MTSAELSLFSRRVLCISVIWLVWCRMRKNVVVGMRASTRTSASRMGSVVEVVAGNKVIGWPPDEVAL
jgi:hypothetical protein